MPFTIKSLEEFALLTALTIILWILVIGVFSFLRRSRLSDKLTPDETIPVTENHGIRFYRISPGKMTGVKPHDLVSRAVAAHRFIKSCGYKLATHNELENALNSVGGVPNRTFVYEQMGEAIFLTTKKEVLDDGMGSELIFAVRESNWSQRRIFAPA